MYRIFCDGYPLLDTNVDELILENPRIKAEVNTVGEGSFSIYNNHPYFDKLKMLKSLFEVSDEYGVIFRGRMTEDTKDFNNKKAVDLEGAMAFFNDSVVRPYRFPEDFEEDAGYIAAAQNGNVVKFYLNWLIENHNAQVEEEKRFKLGEVTVADPNNYITRADTDYPKTWSVLSGKLFNSSLGGKLCIRYEEDGNYIDYLSEFTEINEQGITYGENLLDISQNTVGSAAYSAIIPRGAKIGENEWEGSDGAVTFERRISIEELPDGNVTDDIVKSGDMLYSKSAVAAFGWRYAPVSDTTWDDVTEPSNLRRKGAEFLSGDVTKLPNEIKVTAVDLHCTDAQIRSLRIYKKIRVDTPAHDISDTFDLTSLDIPLLSPQSTKITVGKTVMTLTEYQNKQNSDFQSVIAQTTNKVVKEFSSQKTLIETTSKEVKVLAEWQKGTEEALALISAGVKDNAAKIALVVGDGDEVEGSLIIAAINGESTAKISADRLDIEGKTLDIKVNAANITGSLSIGQLPSGVAKTGDIPTNVSQLNNDSKYQTESGVTTIIDGRVTADFIKALKLEVGDEILMGENAKIAWANVTNPPTIPTNTNQLTNGAGFTTMSAVEGMGYQNASQVTQITKDTITSTYIKGLKLEVGEEIAMGANAKISWSNVDSKPDVATKSEVSTAQTNATNAAVSQVEKKGYATTTQVSTAKAEAISAAATDATSKANAAQTAAISTASSDATTKANNAKTAAVNEVKGLGYQTADQVTTITKNTITTSYVNALNITANSASVASKITVSDVFEANAETGVLKIGGWKADSNSLQSEGAFGKDGYLLLCSTGTIETASVGGSPNQSGWAILAGSHFGVDTYGNVYADNAYIKGEINATSGLIGGLNISSQTISSGNDGLTFTSDGLVIAQNLEVREDFEADTLKIGHIGGRIDGASAFHFESTVEEMQDVNVTVTITEEPLYDLLSGQYRYAFLIECDVAPVSSFTVEITYWDATAPRNKYTVIATVKKGKLSSLYLPPEYDYPYLDRNYTGFEYTPQTIKLATGATLSAIGCEGNLAPFADAQYQLGSSDLKWNEIWATNGTIQTSDQNEKNTISPIAEKYGEVFDKLVPVTYKFNVNTSDRLHLGLIAQDVKRALDEVGIDSKDFAAYCEWEKEDGSIGCGMRYTELIPLLIYVVQKQNARINELEERIPTNEQ